jgi:hypothetical protein
MPKEAPFDVWDGEELGLTDEVEDVAAEEDAMHLDPESEVVVETGPHWSELTEAEEVPASDAPVSYFADEHPEPAAARTGNGARDEREPDLEELLERQHYAFPE